MWLPRPVYEAIPYASVVVGRRVLRLRVLHRRWRRADSRWCLGGVLVTVGIVLWMKRRDYRSAQTDYNPRALDE